MAKPDSPCSSQERYCGEPKGAEMVIGLVLLAGLAVGWASGVGCGTRSLSRVFLAFPLGVASILSWFFLISLLSWSPLVTMGVATAAALLYGLWSGRFLRPTPALCLGWPFVLLFLLASAVGWLSMIGGCQLDPPPEFLLCELPRIAQLANLGLGLPHPLGPDAVYGVTRFSLLAALGDDPWRSSLLLSGVAQVLTVSGCLTLLLGQNRRAPLAMALAALALFLGSEQGWLVSRTPWQGTAHLLLIVSLSFFQRRPLHALPLLGGLALLAPHWALAAGAALFVRLPRRFWVGLLGAFLGMVQGGLGLSLIAAAFLAWKHPNRFVRALCAAEFVAPGLFGLAALGMALGRSLTVLWRRFAGERLQYVKSEGAQQIPRRSLVGVVAVGSLWLMMATGEEAFNDDILIASQKQKVKVSRLIVPDRLSDWAVWRGEHHGLTQLDLQAVGELRRLEGALLYLTGELEEKAYVAALLSTLAGGRELAGWYVGRDGSALLPAAGAVAATGQAEWLAGTPVRWLLRRGQPPTAIEPSKAAAAFDQTAEAYPTRYQRWGRLRWYTAPPGSRYQVLRNGVPFGPDFGVVASEEGEAPFSVPHLVGSYTLSWPDLAVGNETFIEVDPEFGSLPLSGELLDSSDLPSRSLLPMRVKLINQSDVVLELDEIEGGRLTLRSLTGKPDRKAPISPLSGLSLAAREEKEVELFLRTPLPPDRLRVSLDLFDRHGRVHAVRLAEGALTTTWNRRPPMTLPEGVLRHTP